MAAQHTEEKEKAKAYARITSEALAFTTNFFHCKDFTQLMPVILSPVTDPLGPDPNSSVIKTGEIEYYGQVLCMTQSMILHKQLALKKGLDRIFIVSPNVRLEHESRSKSGRHLFEFSQVDFEIAGWKMDDVFGMMEDYMAGVSEHVASTCEDELALLGRAIPKIRGPFPKYTTHELEQRYGKEWEHAASLDHSSPFWALCHKREFYDKEDPDEPGHYLNYDLIYPEGFGEALSGAEREHEYGRIVKRIGHDKIGLGKYKPYIELAKGGLVPSAGAGFGMERLVRYLSGAKHIGEVQLFRRVPGESVIV
jgi:asparaginyl-tRNA synthetase